MKIGILEYRDNGFINDVIPRLSGVETEFISFKEQKIPNESNYKVIVDRLNHQDLYLLEVLKNLSIKGTYVINNPFSYSMHNKIVDTTLLHKLGIPFPKTVVLPMYDEDFETEGIVTGPNLSEIMKEIEFPCIMKPFNGYAWENVFTVNSLNELNNLYTALKSKNVFLLQEKIEYVDYYRAFCIGNDVLFVKYTPKPYAGGEFVFSDLKQIEGLVGRLTEWSIKLNRVLDLDFNAVEWAIDENGKTHVIDAFNDVPDVVRGQLPDQYYNWILEKFSQLVLERFNSEVKNKTMFDI